MVSGLGPRGSGSGPEGTWLTSCWGSCSVAGLQVSRFCFCSEEDFVDGLLKNNVRLFVTTDEKEEILATQEGRDMSSGFVSQMGDSISNPLKGGD